jgi:hypothetical protein
VTNWRPFNKSIGSSNGIDQHQRWPILAGAKSGPTSPPEPRAAR